MIEKCNNTSVGIIVWQEGKILLIERKKFPFGFAPPAGHVDADDASFEQAAKRELQEEVGLVGESLALIAEGRRENPCRRPEGSWHYWQIFQAEARGELRRSEAETKGANFYTKAELAELAAKTERYLRGEVREEQWEKDPGLEPVWNEWLKQL
jgi:ADP-ribose pyrophosphatase YjhB (NUDIX family)